MHPGVRNGLTVFGVAAGYVVCALIGTVLSVPPDGFAMIWPATAFLIAVLLVLPPRGWWCVAAVVPAHFLLAATLRSEAPLVVLATQISGNLVLAFATVLAVRRTMGPVPRFDTFMSVLKFVAIAGIAVPALVNPLTLGVHLATGWTDDLWQSWQQWMIAGFFPTITVPPLVMLTAAGRVTGRLMPPPALRLELLLLAGLLFMLSLFAFGGMIDSAPGPALFLAPLPLLLWAAVRLGVGGTCLSLLVLAAGIVVQALLHKGPFAPQSALEDVVSLQMFLVTRSAPVILLAALMDERRRSADLLRQFEAGMQVAASQTDTGLWLWHTSPPRLWLTANCQAMFGLPDDATNTPYDFLDAVHPEDKIVVGEALRAALADGARLPVLEFRLRMGDTTRWFVLQTRTECDETGRPISVSGVFRDISERIESRLAVERLEEKLATLQDDERRRIAQELHDSTAQHLVAAQLHLLNLRTRIPEHDQSLIDEAYHSLREATAEIRTFTYLLHASQIEEEGLEAMLRLYVPGFERRTGLRTSLRLCPRADELPGELQQALLRIVQESLGNAQRHAGAKRVAVDMRCFSDSLHLVVRDDGRGIGPEEAERLAERLRLGVGLPGMTVRVRARGNRTGHAGRERGTTIHVSVPVHGRVPVGMRGIANMARETLGAGRG